MNSIDIILSILLIYTAYKGYKKGLIYQAASLVALVLGIYGAIKFSDYTANLLTEKLDVTTQYLPLISFAITFIGIVILVHLLAGLTEKIMDAVAMGIANKILGLVFGILKSAFILSICLVIIVGFDKNEHLISQEAKEKSLLFKPVYILAPTIFPYLKFEKIKENISHPFDQNKV